MSEDLEERFRAACSAYLAAAEQHGRAERALEAAQAEERGCRLMADRARDELVRIVRERDAQARLDYGPAGGPVGDGHDEERAEHYGQVRARAAGLTRDAGGEVWPSDDRGAEPVAMLRTVTRPEKTDWWAQHAGMCPECGISWRKPSPDCPHKMVNWHPLPG